MTTEQENSGSEQETAQASEHVFTQPTKRAKIMRGIVTPIFGLLAVACIVLGVLNATEWKPNTSVTASASVSGGRYIVTDPGVLPLVDKQTKLTVSASGSSADICVVVGSAKDVAGWIAGESYTRITGLTDWATLSIDKAQEQGNPDTSEGQVAIEDSDMWLSAKCGTREVSMNVTEKDLGPDEANVALIDLGAKKSADVSMHWTRTTVPDFAMPFYLCAVLFAILAVLSASVFAMSPQKRRHRATLEAVEAAQEELAADAPSPWATATLSAIPAAAPAASRRARRRHALRRAESQAEGDAVEQPSTPSIVDPSARNMVTEHAANDGLNTIADAAADTANTADAANNRKSSDAGETTSVITQDELQAYFARLAQEAAESNNNEGSKEA